MNELVQRFLRYVTFNTQSNPSNPACPSSEGQRTFAQFLQQELLELGLSDVLLDDNGYLMAKLPSNVDYDVPAIGFVAHMDTAPDASGKNVKPQIVEDYQGGDIDLGKGDEVLSPIQYPELRRLLGHNLITSDGTTLLGADNKAGIAEIISAVAELKANPDIPHGDICIGLHQMKKLVVVRTGLMWRSLEHNGPIPLMEVRWVNWSTKTLMQPVLM